MIYISPLLNSDCILKIFPRSLAKLETSLFRLGRLLLASSPLRSQPRQPLLRQPRYRRLLLLHPTANIAFVFQEGALEEAQQENERLKEKISGLKQQYGPIGKQGRVILQQLGAQLGRQLGGIFGFIVKAGDEKRRKARGKSHDIIPLAVHNVKSE